MNNPNREGVQIASVIAALRAGDTVKALDLLQQLGEAALDPLIDLLHHSDDRELRSALIGFLDEIDDLRIVPALIDTLEHDQNADVRLAAAAVLAQHPDTRSIEPLIRVIHEGDPALRETAARTLGEIGAVIDSPRIVAALAQALQDSDWGTRQSAAEMLIGLEAPQREEAQGLLLADLQNDDAEIRLGAAHSLIELGDRRGSDALVDLLDHENGRIRVSAAGGLARLGDQRAVSTLTAALSDADQWVRSTAEFALRDLHDNV